MKTTGRSELRNILFDADVLSGAERHCDRSGILFDEVVNKAVREYLIRVEFVRKIASSEHMRKRYRKGGSHDEA